MKNDEEFGKVDALGINRVALMDINEVKESAERRLGLGGYTAGTDQWLIWEAIRNICLELEARNEDMGRPDEEGKSGDLPTEAGGDPRQNAQTLSPQRGKREGSPSAPDGQGDAPLRVDGNRIGLCETGIYVRAMHEGQWDTYDIVQLDRKSLARWCDSWTKMAVIDLVCDLLDHERTSL